MINSEVYKYAYEGYTHTLNGQGKKAVKSFTTMYREGAKNPTQAKFDMERAHQKASFDYESTTSNSQLRTFFNGIKAFGRSVIEYVVNKDFRVAENNFYNEYKKLYPKTGNIRNAIISERNMP